MEIRAGTGGDEAGIFCGDLYGSFSGHLKIEPILEAVREMTPTNPANNTDAARLAFDQVQTIEPGDTNG